MSTMKVRLYVSACEVVSKLESGLYLDLDACMYISQTGEVYVGAQDEETVTAMRRVMVSPQRQSLWKSNSDYYSLDRFEASSDPEIMAWFEAIQRLLKQERSGHESLHGGVANKEVSMASD